MSKSEADEEEISEMGSFVIDEDIDHSVLASKLALFAATGQTQSLDGLDGEESMEGECISVDQETQARLEALLEAAGIGKLSTSDGKAFADPEVLRRLTSSVSCALDEAAAALSRMRAETGTQDPQRSLAEACSDGDIGTVRRLLNEGRSVHETTEDGESLLSLACSAGYYELAEVLLSMRANIEDRGSKGECTPLMEAASGGYKDIVELLIAHGADVNATSSSSGNTALHYACCGGYAQIVEILIDAGADLEVHNENGHTPLMEAASGGHVDVGKILLKRGAGINTHSNEFKESALTLACYKGHLEMVRFLLEAGADQEHKTDEMHTALMEASMDGHVDVARLLLNSGAQVNMPADSFESPLTLAACGGHVELASLLLVRGANVEEVNDEGYTPLMEASREGHEEMVAILLAHGAKVNVQTEETQETALTLACCGGFLECCKLLVHQGADLESGCSTPLMEASQEGHLDLVQFLIQQSANVQAQTSSGDTALSYACEHGHTDVADLLLSAGASLEQESEGGRTPLMKAARAGHLCTVQFLISRGADVNRATRNNDHTVLSLACFFGHLPVVELLLCQGADPLHKLKDNSTMLLEAAKGGHTAVVQLLLDFPQNFLNTSVTIPSNVQITPPISDQSTPRVPTQALPMIVPPQEPDKAPCNIQWYSKNGNEKVGENYEECAIHQCGHFQPIRSSEIIANENYNYPTSPSTHCPPSNPAPSTPTQPQLSHENPSLDTPESVESVAALREKFLQCMASGTTGKNRTAESIVEEAQGKLTELEQRIKEAIEKNAQLKSLELLQTDQLTKEAVEAMYKTREEQIMKKQKILEELQKVERELQLKTQQQLKKHYEEAKEESVLLEDCRALEKGSSRGMPDGEDSLNIASEEQESPSETEGHLDNGRAETDATPTPMDGPHPSNESSKEAANHKCSILAEFFEKHNLNKLNTEAITTQKENAEVVLNFVLSPNEQEKEEKEQAGPEIVNPAQDDEVQTCNHRPCTTPHLVHPVKQKPDMSQLDVAPSPIPLSQVDTATVPGCSDTPPGFRCPNIDCCTESNHDTPLTLACAGGHEELVQLLIGRNANIEHRDKKGFTPLILAATAGHVGVVSILLDNNADIESQSERTKDTPLSLACSGGRLEVVELLLARGANKEHRNVSDYTPLSLAASGGYVKIIELLLEAGAEINSRTGSKLGISPLMLAAMNGHTHAVMLLLEMGADINAQIETNRNTALTLACFQGRHEVVSLLVDRRANVEHRAKTGLTPLMEAASGGYAEVGRVLLEKGADVNAAPVPSSRDTALTIAADKGHYRFCELVIANDAQIDVRNKKGNTPLWLACNGGHLDVAQLLVSKGADPNAADNRNITPLMAAFRKGHVKETRWLVKEVSQFPSDAECMRYIATISDRELLKRCHMCMECIVAAKDRQAQEANKYASELLQELDMEKSREENRRERAARKREKRRNKRKQKQQQAKGEQGEEEDTENEEKKDEDPEPSKEKQEKVHVVKAEAPTENRKRTSPCGTPSVPASGAKASASEPQISSKAVKKESAPDKKRSESGCQDKSSSTQSYSSENQSPPIATPDKKETRSRDPAPHSAKKSNFPQRSKASSKPLPTATKPRSSVVQHAPKATSSVAPSPGKRGQRKDEGWKEVVRKSKRVMVSAALISRVIGRGGCNINAIREVTGAHIDIDKQRKAGQERTVTIRGPTESIRHAHMLITELTREDKSDQDINAIIMKAQADAAAIAAAKASSATAAPPTRKIDVVEAPLPAKPAWTVPPMIVKPSSKSPVPTAAIKPPQSANERPHLAVCTVQGNNVIRPSATANTGINSVRKALFPTSGTASPLVTEVTNLMSKVKLTDQLTSGVPSSHTNTVSTVAPVLSVSTAIHSGAATVSFMSKTADKHNNRPVQPVAPMVSLKSLPAKTTGNMPPPMGSTVVVTTNHTFVSLPNSRLTQSAHVMPQQHLVRHVNAPITNASTFRSPIASQYSVVPGSQISANSTPAASNSSSVPAPFSPFSNLYTFTGRSSIWSEGGGPATYTNANAMSNSDQTSVPLPTNTLNGQLDLAQAPTQNFPSEVVSSPIHPTSPMPEHPTSVQESLAAPVGKHLQQVPSERTSAAAPSVTDPSSLQFDRKIRPIGTERAFSQRRGVAIHPNPEMENVGAIWTFSDAPPAMEPASWASNVKDPSDIVQDGSSSGGPVSPPQTDKINPANLNTLEENERPNELHMQSLTKIYSKDVLDPTQTAKMSSVASAPGQMPLTPQAQNMQQSPFPNQSGIGTQPPIGSHLGGGLHGYGAIRQNLPPKQPIGAHLANQPKNLHFQQQRKFPNQGVLDFPQRSDVLPMPHTNASWQPNMLPVAQHPEIYKRHMPFNNTYKHQNIHQQYNVLSNHGDGVDPSLNREVFFATNVQHSFPYQAQQQAMYNAPYLTSDGMKGVPGDMKEAPNGPMQGHSFPQQVPDLEQMKAAMYRSYDAHPRDNIMCGQDIADDIWEERSMHHHPQAHAHYEAYHPSGHRLSNNVEGELVSGSTGFVNHSVPNESQVNWNREWS